MKKIIVLFLALFLNTTFLFAQKADTTGKSGIGMIITPTYSVINLNKLNNRLNQYNYATLPDNCYRAGFEMTFVEAIDANIDSGYGYSTVGMDFLSTAASNSSQIQSSLSEFRGVININFCYPLGRKFFIGPMVGIGFSSATFSITDKSIGKIPFDSTLIHLTGQRDLFSGYYFTVNTGLGINKLFVTKKKAYWSVGLRGGYNIQLNKPNWKYNNIILSDYPKINMGGFYASFVLGWFKFYR